MAIFDKTKGYNIIFPADAPMLDLSTTQDSATDLNGIGCTVRGADSTGRFGKWVYCKSGGTVAANNCVKVSGDGTTLTQMYTVVQTTTATQGTEVVAGVAVGAITNGQFGWIQTEGYATPLCTAGAAAGSPVIQDNAAAGTAVLADAAEITNAFGVGVAAIASGALPAIIKCDVFPG